MDNAMKFKKIIAQYCNVKAEDMTDDMRLREDLGLSSLDFMTLMGELEDTFDVELEQENAANVRTIADAMQMLEAAAAA